MEDGSEDFYGHQFEKKNGENISIEYIVESGDGYIRFSNGIQICYNCHFNDGYCHDGDSIIFKREFSQYPVTLTLSRYLNKNQFDSSTYSDIFYDNLGKAGFTIHGDDSADSGKCINFSYIAIGFWK